MSPLPRRVRHAAAVAALSLVPASLALAPAPGQAAEVATTIDFAGCEVRSAPYGANTQVGPETTWSPSLELGMPSVVASRDAFTVDVELGAMPADLLPEDLTDVKVEVYHLKLVTDHWNPLNFYSEFHLPSLEKSAPLAFPAMEYDTDYVDPGNYVHRVKSIFVLVGGQNAADEFVEYSFECDQVVNPQPILTTAVYDLSGTPELTLDRSLAQVGQSVAFDGKNLLAVAPASPRAQATVTIAGRPAGTVEVDDSGAVHGSLVVPAGLSGTVEVRVSNGAKSATAMLQLSETPGGGPIGGVDVNNPATWHINAQGDVVNGLAQVKVAAKKVRSGKKLKLGGSGFAPGEAVIVKAKGGKGKGARVFTKVVYANAVGAIKAGLKLKRAAKGKWRVTAIGVASGRGGLAKFKVR